VSTVVANFFNNCFVFRVAKDHLDATFPRKRHFRRRHTFAKVCDTLSARRYIIS